MDSTDRRGWIRAALLAGAIYLLIGRLFTQPSENVRAWRLAAWVISGVVYSIHIWYEHFRLGSFHRVTALHVAAGVAIGAFGLAVAGMLHSLSTVSTIRPVWFLALLLWPAVTGVPAFLLALVIAALLTHFAPAT